MVGAVHVSDWQIHEGASISDHQLITFVVGSAGALTTFFFIKKDPKAYRPITLLPILGKILERLIIASAPSLQGNNSPSQHGFVRGKSTVTALHAVLNRVASTEHNFVQLIFVDISGG